MSKIRVNKKLILAGSLLVVATICYWIFLTSNAQLEELDISWWIEAIPTTIEFVFLALYCFKFHKTKANKLTYLIGFGAFGALFAYYLIDDVLSHYPFDILALYCVLSLACSIFFIIVKIKPSRLITIAGTFVIVSYILLETVLQIAWNGYYSIYLVCESTAFILIWINETSQKTKAISTKNNSIEDTLVSLKQLYDKGIITEEEYRRKKSELFKQL